ncbi:MAG: hypothetical protein M1542_08420 [Thermotogae bacterium]|jgi:hypothetical protein|nr:hypothetical protein [Thermotogota bacterium]
MAEIINPFVSDEFLYLGFPALIPSAVAGWFMSVQESDRASIVGFAPIFVDKAVVQKYFQSPLQLKIQRAPQSIDNQIKQMDRQNKVLKGEDPDGNNPAG